MSASKDVEPAGLSNPIVRAVLTWLTSKSTNPSPRGMLWIEPAPASRSRRNDAGQPVAVRRDPCSVGPLDVLRQASGNERAVNRGAHGTECAMSTKGIRGRDVAGVEQLSVPAVTHDAGLDLNFEPIANGIRAEAAAERSTFVDLHVTSRSEADAKIDVLVTRHRVAPGQPEHTRRGRFYGSELGEPVTGLDRLGGDRTGGPAGSRRACERRAGRGRIHGARPANLFHHRPGDSNVVDLD